MIGSESENPMPVQLMPVSTLLGAPAGDLEDLTAGTVALAGLYCDHFGGAEPGARLAARQIRYGCSHFARAARETVRKSWLQRHRYRRSECLSFGACEKLLSTNRSNRSHSGNRCKAPCYRWRLQFDACSHRRSEVSGPIAELRRAHFSAAGSGKRGSAGRCAKPR